MKTFKRIEMSVSVGVVLGLSDEQSELLVSMLRSPSYLADGQDARAWFFPRKVLANNGLCVLKNGRRASCQLTAVGRVAAEQILRLDCVVAAAQVRALRLVRKSDPKKVDQVIADIRSMKVRP